MVDIIGIVLSLIGAFVMAGVAMSSGNIVIAIIVFIVSFGFLNGKFQEGASKGSGFRQEMQNEEILNELRSQKSQTNLSSYENNRVQNNNDELDHIDEL